MCVLNVHYMDRSWSLVNTVLQLSIHIQHVVIEDIWK